MKKKLHMYEMMCIILLLGLFSIIAWKVRSGGVTIVDEYVRTMVKGFQTEASLSFFRYFTKLGSAIGIVSVLVVSLFFFWKKRYYVAMVIYPLSIISTNLINKLIKSIVKRNRPNINEALDALGYSFPSGHAMLAIVTYGFLAYIIAANVKSAVAKCFVTILAIVVIVLIGLSRIILSVHYPTDVLAGYCIGGVLLIITIYLHRLFSARFQTNQER
ncbi:Phosphatidylglycerophosphatase B [Bacillus rhizoplanae]|uniref:Phosphatidylglycerophosphatase B n=1 Tax=Bacillus rhizoplanae TaxID=2880966 RepID=A0ABN8A4A0_9BACI|nr:phosphatase PAP2 family protein [Bacillus rhizoplanae]CAG9614030.1 Phosphatidylglycerophosphatase B [Bacillus rhizoplanae]